MNNGNVKLIILSLLIGIISYSLFIIHFGAVYASNVDISLNNKFGIHLAQPHLDELEKKGIEVIPCSGLIRVKRFKKKRS